MEGILEELHDRIFVPDNEDLIDDSAHMPNTNNNLDTAGLITTLHFNLLFGGLIIILVLNMLLICCWYHYRHAISAIKNSKTVPLTNRTKEIFDGLSLQAPTQRYWHW